MPIEALGGYSIELRDGHAATSPLGVLARSLPQGGRTPLAAGLFRCERWRRLTRRAVLVEQPAVDGRRMELGP